MRSENEPVARPDGGVDVTSQQPGWPRAYTSRGVSIPYPPPPEFYETYATSMPPQTSMATEGVAVPPSAEWLAPMAEPARVPGQGDVSVASPPPRTLRNILLSAASALLSLVIYVVFFGPSIGIGIVVLLFVHEMGHFVVIRAKGLPAHLPVFIPLIGAYVAMPRLPRTVRDEAEIALAGPLAGALGGLACIGLYRITGDLLFLPLAQLSFVLNLLNLLPITPLDGGRIVGAISRWLWPVGLLLVIGAFLRSHNVLLLVLLWFSAVQIVAFLRIAGSSDYYRISFLSRAYVTVVYVALAAMLVLAMFGTQGLLSAQHIRIWP